MKRYHLFVFILASIICGGCKDTILSNAAAEEVRQEVEETLNKCNEDVRKNGLLAEFNYLDSSSAFSWQSPGSDSPISYDSVATILRDIAGTYTLVDNSFDSLTILPASKVKATYFGIIHSVMVDTSGHSDTTLLEEEGVMIKRDDGWKFLSGKTKALTE